MSREYSTTVPAAYGSIQLSGLRQASRLLEAQQGIPGGKTLLAVDHPGGEAKAVENDLRLHHLTRAIVRRSGVKGSAWGWIMRSQRITTASLRRVSGGRAWAGPITPLAGWFAAAHQHGAGKPEGQDCFA